MVCLLGQLCAVPETIEDLRAEHHRAITRFSSRRTPNVAEVDDPGDTSVRMAELLGALSFGIDLGFSQPMEHVLRQCRIALRLAELVDLDTTDRQAVFYAALLVNVGCHTDAHEQARWFGDDIALRASKFEHEPFSVGDMTAMLRLLGSGGTPLHRVRIAFDFASSARKNVDGMITAHARLARR